MNIKEELIKLQDKEYMEFNKKICPDTKLKMLGIRVPKLRQLAKEILKEYSRQEALKNIGNTYFEEIMLKGFIIGYSKDTFKNKEKDIKNHIKLIDSWAISDTFVPTIKPKISELEEVYEFLKPYLKSSKEFEVRVAVIFLLDYFITEKYVDEVLTLLDEIENDKYYVQMAVAWTLAEIGIKFNDKLMNYLKSKNNLDKFTYNKTLQKLIESRRISNEQKLILKKMKK